MTEVLCPGRVSRDSEVSGVWSQSRILAFSVSEDEEECPRLWGGGDSEYQSLWMLANDVLFIIFYLLKSMGS